MNNHEHPHIKITFDSYDERDRWLDDNHPSREVLNSAHPGLYYSEGESLGVNGLTVFTWRNDNGGIDDDEERSNGPDLEEQYTMQTIIEGTE